MSEIIKKVLTGYSIDDIKHVEEMTIKAIEDFSGLWIGFSKKEMKDMFIEEPTRYKIEIKIIKI